MADAATDEALMLSFARGDAAAFEELYRRHEPHVYRYLSRNTRDAEIASDLMQDVWFSVARSAAAYQPKARFTTWLYTLAHNRLIDAWRARRDTESLNDNGASGDVSARLAADPHTEPAVQAEARETGALLLRAVERLPGEQRAAFLLQAEAGLSVEEIATVTGTNFETAKSRLRYARARLRELLWDHA